MRCINDFEAGSRLQKLCESKGNNKTDLSIELNISTAQYGLLESGKSRISSDMFFDKLFAEESIKRQKV